jgi:ParB family chromosome partitioning protein
MSATANPTVTSPVPATDAVPVTRRSRPDRPMSAKTALPGKRGNMVHMAASDLYLITDKAHPLYDPRIVDAMDPAFIANIATFGVQVPVLVAKLKIDGVVKNVVIDGKQRSRAANVAVRPDGAPVTVPAIVVKGDTEALYSLMILANENRREDGHMAKARKVARFVELYLSTDPTGPVKANTTEAKKQAALIFGTTVKTIEGRLKLLLTSPAVQAAVEAGRIGWWAASEFAGLPFDEQDKLLEEVIAAAAAEGKKPTVEDAKVKAGKGEAPKREKLKIALLTLKEAALDFGEATAANDGVKEAREVFLAAGLAYTKAAFQAQKESAKAAKAAAEDEGEGGEE